MRGCKHGQRMGGGVARHTKAQAEQTREAILDAAEKVFYERGVARSTLEEVARVAGVTRGAIYWHFRDKLDLFLTLNERAELPHQDLVTRLAENPELDPLEELDTVMADTKRQFEQDERRRRLLTIFYQRCEYVDEMAPALHRLQKADEDLRAKFRELLHLAAARYPLAPPWTPDTAADALFVQIRGMMQLWLREPEVYRLSEEGLQLARALLASFRGSPLKTELKTPGNPGGPADRPPPAG